MTDILSWGLRCILYLLLQFFVFRFLVLSDVAVAHVFLLPLLLLPFELPRPWLYLVAFVLGYAVDSFTLPLGPHAIACLMVIGVREFWVGALSPQAAFGDRDEVPLLQQPLGWHLGYLPVMFLVFELTYFTVADWGLSGMVLLKALASTLYTSIISLIFLALFHKRG